MANADAVSQPFDDAPASAVPALVQTIQWLVDPVGYVRRRERRHGGRFALDIAGWGRLILVSDPVEIREILSRPTNELSGGDANRILEPVVGPRSVFLLEGGEHRSARRLLKPLLTPRRFVELYPAFRAILTDWSAGLPLAGKHFDTSLRSLTMRLMTHVIFGCDDPSFARDAERRLAPLVGFWAGVLAFVPSLQKDFGPLAPIRRLRRNLAAFHRLLDRQCAACPPDFDAKHEQDAVYQRDQIISILIAGYDTTASSMAWVLHWIFATDGLAQRLRDELAGIEAMEGEAYAMRLQDLPLLDAVCTEALRIMPVVDFYPRTLTGSIASGRRVFVAPCSLLLHNDPAIFDRPDQFRPDRFIEDPDRARYVLAYGGGTRRCPGGELSRFMTKLSVAHLLTGDFQILPGTVRAVRRNVVLLPQTLRFDRSSATASPPTC